MGKRKQPKSLNRSVFVGAAHQYWLSITPSLLSHLVLYYDNILILIHKANLRYLPNVFDLKGHPLTQSQKSDLNEATLADHWLNSICSYNKKNFNSVKSLLREVPGDIDDQEVNRLHDYFIHAQKLDKSERSTPIFHPRLLNILVEHGATKYPWRMDEALTAIADFICGAILERKHAIGRVMSANEVLLAKTLASSPKLTFEELDKEMNIFFFTEGKNVLQHLMNINSLNELVLQEIGKDSNPAQLFSSIIDLEVPEIGKIPLADLIKYRQKTKLKALENKITEWTANGKQKISIVEISSRIQDSLWEVVKSLWPSIGSDIIGIVSSFPTGPIPVNPVGIISLGQEAIKRYKLRKNYGWLMTIADLKKLSASEN